MTMTFHSAVILFAYFSLVQPMTIPKRQVEYKQVNRRLWLGQVSAFIGAATCFPDMANAVKERNEALCSTGFFTNIAQWYCTDIGDISDEGIGKSLSQGQEASVDSLMSKFDIETTVESETPQKAETQPQDDSSK